MKNIFDNYKVFGLFEILIFVIIYYLIYYKNIYKLNEKYPRYLSIFTLLFAFILILNFYFVKQRENLYKNSDNKPSLLKFTMKIVKTLSMLLIFFVSIFIIIYLFRNIPTIGNIFTFILNIFIFIGFISILYYYVRPYINDYLNNTNNKFIKLISSVVLFIPCIILNLEIYLKQQIKITKPFVWYILLVEIALIVLRIILPKILKSLLHHDGKHLLEDPIYLNYEKVLGTYNDLFIDNSNKDDKFDYNYAISAWINVNPQPPNTSVAYTKYTPLLHFGNKPMIEYNALENKIRITSLNKRSDIVTIYESSNIEFQKWNHFVINYSGGTLDVFINGKLVASQPEIVPYMKYDTIISGSNNGLHGGIKKVVYYNESLTLNKILSIYKYTN